MPVDMTETIAHQAPESPPRKRWTRVECELLDAAGLWQGQHLELIDGELIDKKMGKKEPHVTSVMLMHEWLANVFGFRQTRQAAPINVASEDNATNEPEPDLVVLRQPRAGVLGAGCEPAKADRSPRATRGQVRFGQDLRGTRERSTASGAQLGVPGLPSVPRVAPRRYQQAWRGRGALDRIREEVTSLDRESRGLAARP